MVYIYILKLEHSKYYIGKSNKPDERIITHYDSNGASWTSVHKPIDILDVIPNCDEYDEDKYTIWMMNKYGIDNVRGGSFSKVKLEKEMINILQKMITSSNDKCFKCGEKGHFVKYCKNRNMPIYNEDEEKEDDIYSDSSDDIFDDDMSDDDTTDGSYRYKSCTRCGRKGHYKSKCYAKRHVKGYYIKY